MSFPCVYHGIHTHGHVAKSVGESAATSQALFSINVYLIKKKHSKHTNNNQTKNPDDIYISTFRDKQWAGSCWINSVHCCSRQMDDRHMHSAGKGNGSILETKPIFLFQGRSEPWQADLAGSCSSSRHPYK